MEQSYPTSPSENHKYKWQYVGTGMQYFEIAIINWVLTIITLGLYYPWAKARSLSHLYSKTELENTPFVFTGTGKEMFKGFIKALVVLILWYASFFAALHFRIPLLFLGLYFLFIFFLLPLAIHGSYRYRMSRSEWRGIRFGYIGNRKEFMGKFAGWLLLTIITFGFYGAWFTINLRNYLFSHVKFGNLNARYQGDGTDFFWLNLKGYFLTLITLGIYSFWWQRDLFHYYFDNLMVIDEENNRTLNFYAETTGWEFVKFIIVNILIVIFTLGLGTPFVLVRYLKFIAEHVSLTGNVDLNNLQQTGDDYNDATGDDMLDMLDLGFTF